MISLRKYPGNVFRFGESVMANHDGRPVTIVGVNQPQDHLVVGGYRDDFLVPASELAVPDDQLSVLEEQLAKAKGAIGGPSRGRDS